jgi:hypothetical protein
MNLEIPIDEITHAGLRFLAHQNNQSVEEYAWDAIKCSMESDLQAPIEH